MLRSRQQFSLVQLNSLTSLFNNMFSEIVRVGFLEEMRQAQLEIVGD